MYRTAYLHGQYQYAHTVHTVLYTLTVQLYSAVWVPTAPPAERRPA